MSKAVVVGGSSGVGRALCVSLARRGYDLALVARDTVDLEAVAADARIRFGSKVECLGIDLSAGEFDAPGLVGRCLEELGGIDAVFVTVGRVDDGDRGWLGAEKIRQLMAINLVRPVEVLEAFARHFVAQGSGELTVVTSIATVRPRGRNLVYGAAKSGLDFYGRALRHRLAGTGIGLQIVVLGYVDTAMSFGRRLLLPVASSSAAAEFLVQGQGRDRGVVFFPRFWWWVARVLNLMPRFVYRRMDF